MTLKTGTEAEEISKQASLDFSCIPLASQKRPDLACSYALTWPWDDGNLKVIQDPVRSSGHRDQPRHQ